MKVSFIGLGIMGSRMATNLLKGGVDLTVFNRSKEAVNRLVGEGAKTSSSLSDAVKDADVVFTMLSTPEVVKLIMTDGDSPVLESMKKGAIWADCSTVNPSFSVSMSKIAEQKGIHFVDAPVAGTKPHAENAELVFFVGGDDKTVQILSPYMDMMGRKVMHIGEVGQGASYKMLVNMMLAQSMIIFSEAVILGEKMGLDKSFLLESLPNLVVSAPFTKLKSAMIASDSYDVQFPLEWMHKDLHLAATTAYENNQPLFMANLAKELFAEAVSKGMGRLDFAAIHRHLDA